MCCASSFARRAENEKATLRRTVRARARSRRTSAPDCPPRRSQSFSAPASRTSPASRARCSPSASTSSGRRSPCPCCSAAIWRATRTTFGSAVRVEARRGGCQRRALDELEGGDRLDRQARVHRQRGRPRRALELRPASQHRSRRSTPTPSSSRARVRCRTDSSPGCEPSRRCPRRTTRASTAVHSARAVCRTRISSSPICRRPSRRRSSRPPSSALTRPWSHPRTPRICSRRCGAVVASESRFPVSTRWRRLVPTPPSRCSTRSSRVTTRRPPDEPEPVYEEPAVAEVGRRKGRIVDAVLGRDRLRSPHRRLGSAQANAPSRISGTVRSSFVSEPCWPIIFCAPLSARRSS